MKALTIAENAGRIWRVLEETYTITSTQMMKRLELRNLQLLRMQKPSLLRKPSKTCIRRNSSNNR